MAFTRLFVVRNKEAPDFDPVYNELGRRRFKAGRAIGVSWIGTALLMLAGAARE